LQVQQKTTDTKITDVHMRHQKLQERPCVYP